MKKIKEIFNNLSIQFILGFVIIWATFTLGMSRNGTLAKIFRNPSNFNYNSIDGYAVAGWLVVGPFFLLGLFWILRAAWMGIKWLYNKYIK